MSRRSRAREIVLQVLYQHDLNAETPETTRQRFIAGRLRGDAHLIKFANELLAGVHQHRDQLDQRLSQTADNWKLKRMAATDRNVLRLGAYEILFTDTPDRVAINEAIDLAKRYGTNNSAQFVNGVLDRLMKSKNAPLKKVAAPDAEEPSVEKPTASANDETNGNEESALKVEVDTVQNRDGNKNSEAVDTSSESTKLSESSQGKDLNLEDPDVTPTGPSN